MKIGTREIGPDHPPFIIAECGINHAGDLEVARAMIDEAADAGADAVKFQTHCEDEFSDEPAYPGNAGGESIQDLIKRCSFSESREAFLKQFAEQLGLIYLSTPFSPLAVERLERMGVLAYKVGSGHARDVKMLGTIAATRKPMIISTGMSTLDEVDELKRRMFRIGSSFALLHCTSEYPTHYRNVNLRAMRRLAAPGVPVGLSDHSRGIWTALGAVALGASIIEKHFATPMCPPGPDIAVSIGPDELRDLVIGSRAIWEARGSTKEITPGERETREWFEASRRRS